MHTTQFTTKQYLFGYSDVQKTALMGYSDVLFRKLYGDILLLKNVFWLVTVVTPPPENRTLIVHGDVPYWDLNGYSAI